MKIALAPIALRDYRGGPGYQPASAPPSPAIKEGIKTMLRRVKKAGYEGIEMGTPPGFAQSEYKEYMDEIGLAVVSAAGLRYPALEGEDFSATIEECRALGAKNVMVSNMPNIVLGNPYELGRFIANLGRAGKALAEAGIHLSYHNHAVDFTKINGKTILEQIVDGTDARHVMFEPDTHWIQAGGGHVITWLKRLRGRIYIVHFKDYGIDPYSDHVFLEGTHKQFKEVGEGNLNWPGIIAECAAQGIEWCGVEQDLTQKPPYEAIALSVKNLRAYGV
ncbi:MAG: sugar phosphate isomerase/epimerase [Oscillospiraceae bacterium]|nr:sugar phosphate isomerase/epimerase [Oscillospiraceae bacterium]